MKRQLKQLNKAYHKNIKSLEKQFYSQAKDASLIIFIEYLKYIRDLYILKNTIDFSNTNLMSLIIAIAEFDTYKENIELSQKQFHRHKRLKYLIKLHLSFPHSITPYSFILQRQIKKNKQIIILLVQKY